MSPPFELYHEPVLFEASRSRGERDTHCMLLIVSASSPLLVARCPPSLAAHIQPRRSLLRLCAPDPLKRVADTSGDAVDLGNSASDATSSLEGLADAAAARLNAMGAGEPRVEPVDEGPSRSAFSISRTGAAEREDMDERLRRLRLQGTGALEPENQAVIDAAMKMAKEWARAGLHERAKKELQAVAPYLSFKTDLGANFHLQLAEEAAASGSQAEARKLRQKVQAEASSSAIRWKADRLLGSANLGSSPSSPSTGGKSEISDLFRMPDSWS